MVGSIYYGTLFFSPKNIFGLTDWPFGKWKKMWLKKHKEKNRFPANFYSFLFQKIRLFIGNKLKRKNYSKAPNLGPL
jgi:hypothetical protein